MPFISIEINISKETIANLLASAFEGGSSYWISNIADRTEPLNPVDLKKLGSWGKVYPNYHWPLFVGGKVKIAEKAEENGQDIIIHELDLISIRNGLKVMAKKYPNYFSQILDDNYDSITSDVFLQCCTIGYKKYG